MKITYKNWTFLFPQTESAKPTREQSLSCESISADMLTAVVRCNDPTIMDFAKNDPIRVWESDSDASMQTYYLRSITRTGATSYRLVAWSAVGLLAAMAHKGGIYTGQTVAEVVKEICGNVPVVVKSVFANTKLYGWLPYCQPKADGRGKSARDNLAQVLFAIGAYLTTDLNGVLHIDALWDGASSTIGSNRMYAIGSKVSYSDPVSAVTVTEHQYTVGTDEKELFSGTSQQGDTITFSEPMHSLTATGFTILESGANYAKISSGSGSLKGKTYIHNTRLVTQIVTKDAAENVKSVTDATLVSFVNSSAVAKRLADYYKCRETITSGIVSGQEKPGHVVSVYHPYDKKMVSACIVSLDTTMSGTLKSEMTALVGFLPPQPETTEYYDTREVLTVSGSITVPAGVTHMRAVLIGGAYGGKPGNPGKTGGVGEKFTYTSSVSGKRTYWRTLGRGGKGGSGGNGGQAGKVLVVDIDTTPGQVIISNIGTGGAANSAGTETTFGSYSSKDGSVLPDGYVDQVTGDVYATAGDVGLPGGDGNGWAGGDLNRSNALNIALGAPVGGYGPGENSLETAEEPGYYIYYYIMSGGGARNQNGSIEGGSISTNLSKCKGGNGADATLVPGRPSVPGKGGTGGSGGGGGGGAAAQEMLSNTDATAKGGDGGLGSRGGPGANGAVILYYTKPKIIPSGPLVTSNNLGLLDSLGRRMIV